MDWLRWILLAVGAVLIGAIYVFGAVGRRSGRSEPPLAPGGTGGAGDPPWADRDHIPAVAAAEPDPDPDPDPDSEWLPTDLDRPAWHAPVGDAAVEPEQPDSKESESRQPGPADAPATRDPQAGRRSPGPHNEPAPGAEPASERIIVLYLVAPEGERLVGARLAQALTRHGLEHGELGAFHARSREADGATDFSVANAVEPGAFDPATMDTLSTPGVVIFLRLPGAPSPGPAFERMLATARALAEELDARVLDERRAPLTWQTEQHLRDEVRAAQAPGAPVERSPR